MEIFKRLESHVLEFGLCTNSNGRPLKESDAVKMHFPKLSVALGKDRQCVAIRGKLRLKGGQLL